MLRKFILEDTLPTVSTEDHRPQVSLQNMSLHGCLLSENLLTDSTRELVKVNFLLLLLLHEPCLLAKVTSDGDDGRGNGVSGGSGIYVGSSERMYKVRKGKCWTHNMLLQNDT